MTLGRLALERDGQPIGDIGNRRVPLALLALLAGHPGQGISRDRLLAYLWPESDEPRARNSLKQAIFGLRRELGDSVVVSSGAMLRLDPDTIGSDLADFEAALASGDAAAAVALYGGPFLDGFYVPERNELERWVESGRQRLHARQVDCLLTLARRADAARDLKVAVGWWRRAAAADPFTSEIALGLMRALAGAGDRVGALEHARAYEAALQAELGLPADAAITAFADSLRAPDSESAIAPGSPAAGPFPGGTLAAAMAASGPVAVPVEPGRGTLVRWPGYLLFLLLILVLADTALRLRGDESEPLVAGTPATLTVLPFETAGAANGELGRGLDALLASGLDGLQEFRTVPVVPADGEAPSGAPPGGSAASAAARRSGARLYVVGRLVADRDSLRASASLRDRANADREVSHAEATVSRDELFELADELVRGLVADRSGVPGERLARAAATSTRSLPALKAYLQGEQWIQEEEYAAAIDAFTRAVRADSAFGLAYYRLSVAADRAGRNETSLWAARLASRFSAGLSEHDQRLVLAYLTVRNGRLDEAERLYRGILADYPRDVEAWSQLGELLLRGNPLRGRSAREAREAFESVLALDSTHGNALVPLARIASLEGRRADAEALLRRAETTSSAAALDLRAVRTFALGDRPGHERATRDVLAQPRLLPRHFALEAATRRGDLAGSAQFARLLVRAPGTCDVRAMGHRVLAQLALARGRLRAADAELASAAGCDAGASLELRALVAAHPLVRLPAAELEQLAHDLGAAADTSMQPSVRRYSAGLVALGMGDTLGAGADARDLLATTDSTSVGDLARTFGRSLRARILFQGGHPAEALEELEAAGWERTARLSAAEALDRMLRAELLHQLGRDEEAIGWYRSIAQRASYELVYVAPAELRLGEIYEAAGERGEAAVHYRRFVELWRNADPELKDAVEKANARLVSMERGGP